MVGETINHYKVLEKIGEGSISRDHTYVTQSF